MSAFACPVVRVSIEPHPNADAIELARVGGYLSIVKKGQFVDGDLAVYIPEQSVLPEWLLKEMGFWDDMNGKGKLSGAAGNRVRAMKLRGILSQGLLYPVSKGVAFNPTYVFVSADQGVESKEFMEHEDAAGHLGITKYEPQVPAQMAGKVAGGDLDATIGYDFENLKKHPTLFDSTDDVVITEKIHGTLLQVGLIPKSIWGDKSWADKCPDIGGGFKGIVTSKGQGAKGLMLDPGDEVNLYVSYVKKLGLWDKLYQMWLEVLTDDEEQPVFLFGEIYGADSTQDLKYGTTGDFRAFDLYVGTRTQGYFCNWPTFKESMDYVAIEVVPVLFHGKFSMDVVSDLTDGNTTLTTEKQIREGVVVKSYDEEPHPRYGRKIAKSVSAAYLLRKGEATELQ